LKLKRKSEAKMSENQDLIVSNEMREKLDSAEREKLESWSRIERKIKEKKERREMRVLRKKQRNK
jgi:hypothetical protein